MNKEELKPGDPVEIRFPTHDNVIWNAATVVQNDSGSLCVAFADGRRQAVPHGEGHYRRPIEAANGERANAER